MVQITHGAPLPRPQDVRIRFSKTGALQYISHLDLVRTMHKALVRAGFPLWYTEGYNPHPKLVFAIPLSVGVESLCEFLDVRVTNEMDTAAATAALAAQLTEEIGIAAIYFPTTKLKDIAWLDYRIRTRTPGVGPEMVVAIEALLDSPELLITKNGKGGEKTVNIRPQIASREVAAEGGELLLDLRLAADSANFLNPEHVIALLRTRLGILQSDSIDEQYHILRRRALCADGTDFA